MRLHRYRDEGSILLDGGPIDRTIWTATRMPPEIPFTGSTPGKSSALGEAAPVEATAVDVLN